MKKRKKTYIPAGSTMSLRIFSSGGSSRNDTFTTYQVNKSTMENKKLNFGQAIEALNQGKKVAREGWNGKGMWLELSEYGQNAMYKDLPLHPHIIMATAQGYYVPWLASQTDMLSEDWMVVGEEREKCETCRHLYMFIGYTSGSLESVCVKHKRQVSAKFDTCSLWKKKNPPDNS